MCKMTTFEKEVRKALIDKEMTVSQLSAELGITACYLTDIFKGNRPGTKQKVKIVEFLSLDPKILN